MNPNALRGSSAPQLSLVLPCHNEDRALPLILPRIQAAVEKLARVGVAAEVIVVDDGSTDGSRAILARHAFLRVLTSASCRGYGASLKRGFAEARGARIAFFDLDNTYWPEDLPAFLQTADADEPDVVMGVRPFFASGMPWVRAAGNQLFVWLSRTFLGGTIADLSTGFRMFRRERLNDILEIPSDGLDFSMHLTLRTMEYSWSVRELPIRYGDRVGASKLSVTYDGLRFLRLMIAYRWSQFAGLGAERMQTARVPLDSKAKR